MDIIKIEDNLFLYQFDPQEGKDYGFNIFVLIDGNDVLLIDTAYEPQVTEVLEDLGRIGLILKQVLISHFHGDHVSGLMVLPDLVVWGSERNRETVEKYAVEDQESLPEISNLNDSSIIKFGDFTLNFRLAPGHSPCSIYSIINQHYVHVADNVMSANDGTPILPWAPFDQVEEHIRSLEMVETLDPQVLLMGHGKVIKGKDEILSEVNNRLCYLRAVRDGNGQLSYEEAVAGCDCQYVSGRWHIRNE